MTSPRAATPICATAALAALAIAGCGANTAVTTGSAPAIAAPRVTTSSAAAPATTPTAVRVAIEDFEYRPGRSAIAVGTKVVWTNADTANHTVTFDAGAQRTLGNQPRGVSKSMTFTRAGTFAYHCDYHPNMEGTVVVH